MSKTGKLLIILMVAAAICLPGGVFAAPQLAPYPAAFWLNGKLDAGTTGLPDLSGFKIYFYTNQMNYLAAFAMGVSDTQGNFNVNGLDDLQMLPLSSSGIYYIGVEKKVVGGKSYGVDGQLITIEVVDLNNDYKNIAATFLTLAENHGLDPGLISPLTIQRVADTPGAAVKVSWTDDLENSNPKIYAMTGDGSGQFLNSYNAATWKLIYQKHALEAGVTSFNGGALTAPAGTKSFTNDNQVANGAPEVYYRALKDANDPTTPGVFEAAPAVGKIDKALKQNYNSITLPLIPDTFTLTSVLGDQLSQMDEVHAWSYDNQNFVINRKGMSGWPAGNFAASEGVLIYLKTKATDTLCLVGNVYKKLMSPRTLQLNYESIGLPFPLGKTFDKLGLTPREKDEIHTWDYNNQNYVIDRYGPSGWGDTVKAGLNMGEGKLYYIPSSSTTLQWNPDLTN